MISLQADLEWKTTTPLLENALFRFQMPGIPEEEIHGDLQIWKLEAEGNTYYAVVKSRKCSNTANKLKICDALPLFRYVASPGWKHVSSTDCSSNCKHLLFTDSQASFSHIAFYFNSNIALILATKTADKESPEHKRFIESFAFLE